MCAKLRNLSVSRLRIFEVSGCTISQSSVQRTSLYKFALLTKHNDILSRKGRNKRFSSDLRDYNEARKAFSAKKEKSRMDFHKMRIKLRGGGFLCQKIKRYDAVTMIYTKNKYRRVINIVSETREIRSNNNCR